MKVDLIAGARPNFMKIAPLIKAMQQRQKEGKNIFFRLVHTGQHYDKNMSDHFFEQLGIPDPDVNLGAGGGTQAEQTARIMIGYEKLLAETPTDLCLVVGDVTSTMACSIVAKKQQTKVAHVEAGIRSGDITMPEEVNRIVTDSLTDYFFTTTEKANDNLRRLGVSADKIFFVGNTMIDTLLYQRPFFKAPSLWNDLNLSKGKYLVMTLHRPANVDEESQLQNLMKAIIDNAHGLPLIFPVHPRTKKMLDGIMLDAPNLYMTEPLGYLEFNYLVENAKAVITDSGGITEETTVMGVPCMTLRNSTERPETVTEGTNELLGTDPSAIKPALEKLFKGEWKKGRIPEKWDGKTASRIVDILVSLE
ncbi:MAG: UDP-N-acetylglucosamine 2-epimerase (non-hydrolyzing) [Cyclobacteriaceae bacterium]